MTLVLLPGMDGTGDLFAPLLEAFGTSFESRVVRYPSSGPQGYAELEVVARAALPSGGPFVVVAESFSGPIGISIASTAPPGMVGLVLCCTFVRNPRASLAWLRPLLGLAPLGANPMGLRNRLLLGRFGSPYLRAAVAAALSKASTPALRARLAAVLAVDVSSAFRCLSLPVLYLRASEDRIVPRAAAALVVSLGSRIREYAIRGPHCLLQAAPVESARAIKEFAHGL